LKIVKPQKTPDLYNQWMNDTQSIISLLNSTQQEEKSMKEILEIADSIEKTIYTKSQDS
jgi:K+/H+ antiporter YhaU regulatory subunit KhtT